MYCPNCGKELPEGARFCGNCGAEMPQRRSAAPATGVARAVPAFAGLPVPAILGAFCALFSLFPWCDMPAWLTFVTNVAERYGYGSGYADSYAPWNVWSYGGTINAGNGNGDVLSFIVCIVYSLLWLAALVVLVLGVVDAFAPGTLAMIPVRNMLVIGAIGMVALGLIAVLYIANVNGTLDAQMGRYASELREYLQTSEGAAFVDRLLTAGSKYSSVADIISEGLNATLWLWASIGFGVATIVTSIFYSRKAA